MSTGLAFRPSGAADADALWAILHAVLTAGDTYTWPPETSREDALALWHPPGGHTVVAHRDGRVAGTYLLKANQPGLGDHVANCGYMVAPEARGQGVGEALCRHSLDVARSLGFRAMQFNAVASTNLGAIRLWERCGFAIVGTVPGAFRHPRHGEVAIHVMHRLL
jgi:GNAT superfamily N-acetyltransferase